MVRARFRFTFCVDDGQVVESVPGNVGQFQSAFELELYVDVNLNPRKLEYRHYIS